MLQSHTEEDSHQSRVNHHNVKEKSIISNNNFVTRSSYSAAIRAFTSMLVPSLMAERALSRCRKYDSAYNEVTKLIPLNSYKITKEKEGRGSQPSRLGPVDQRN